MTLKKILLKLSGELISWDNFMFDYDKIQEITKKVVKLSKEWLNIAIVCGAWNIWRYRDTLNAGIDRVKSDHLGMMATVMNAVLLNEKVIQNGWKWIVFSQSWTHIPPITKEYNSLSAREKMNDWYITFCAGGSGNPYSTTDLGAILRALELECDAVVKITKVDWIYDKDPKKYKDAIRFEKITFQKAIELGIEIMDQSAIWMAKENKKPIFVCNIDQIENLTKNPIWTRVHV